MEKRIGEACAKCMHGQTMSDPKYIYCSFWLEVVHKLHSCIAYENEQDSFYQSLNPYVRVKYRRMFKDDFTEVLKCRLDPGEFKQGLESHQRHVERTNGAF
ncbi:hypothetical protein [Flagellimonas aequoris]|uniref:Uncharacterized protein n=2 Tax=Flagellimonas aequoris TaxID=2306997 RepID=A0ABY3KPN7_9FLAO|nr:hypothetical protein [Allomuricauda aequoris]TXK00417.1 hypothetical protein FQ019_15960 [Allomuricauda aequoris]